MYWPRLSVCLSDCPSPHFPHYCTDPDVTWGNGRGCPLVLHCWADLQSLHGFHCYDNIHVHVCKLIAFTLQMRIALNAKCQRVLVLACTRSMAGLFH